MIVQLKIVINIIILNTRQNIKLQLNLVQNENTSCKLA